jgi:hypothetical protein
MKFLNKTIILTDVDNNSVCIFVDKITYIKEYVNRKCVRIGTSDGVAHSFNDETICSFLRKVQLGCEECRDAK